MKKTPLNDNTDYTESVLEPILKYLPYIAYSIFMIGLVKWMKENNIDFRIVELSQSEYEILNNKENNYVSELSLLEQVCRSQ
jgi:hypothetical protein